MKRALSPPSVLSGSHPSPAPLPLPPPLFPCLSSTRQKTKRSTGKEQKQTQWTKAGAQQTETKQGATTTTTTSNTQVAGNRPHRFAKTHPNLCWMWLYACVAVSANLCKKNKKADSTLGTSQAVPHPSTIRALCHLTSEVGRDPVYLTRYGRQRIRKSTKHL